MTWLGVPLCAALLVAGTGSAVASDPPVSAPRASAPPAAAAAEEDSATMAWTQARALADQGRHDEALGVIRDALRRYPDNTDLLWLEAGVTGWAERHGESVALYERLLVRHPELARDVRQDLATERLWAGDAKGALRDFDLRLAEDPSDGEARRLRALALSQADRLPESLEAYDKLLAEGPDDLDLALERARVLGWMGRHDAAEAAYQEILRRHPGELRARLGLAQNENWKGNHRQAARLYEEMLREGHSDPEISKGLAYAYYWDDRPERSRTALGTFVRQQPEDKEGYELARMLEREDGPHLITGYERSDDTDALRIRTTTMEYEVPLRRGTTLSLRLRSDDVEDAGGNREPLQIGAGLDQSWSEQWSTGIALYYFLPASGEEAVGMGEASVGYRPFDRLRLDLGFSKEPVLTRLSLAQNIAVRTVATAVDWRFRDQTTLHVDQRLRYYTDDNRSTTRTATLRGLVFAQRRTRLGLSFEVTHLKTHLDLDDGYYDPERYIEFGPGVDVEFEPSDRLVFRFDGRIGQQQEKGEDREPYHNFTAGAEVALGQVVALNLEGGRSNSNLSSASGFRQTRWAVYLTTRF